VAKKASEAASLKLNRRIRLHVEEKIHKAESSTTESHASLIAPPQNLFRNFPVFAWQIYAAALFLFTSINCETILHTYTFQ